MPFELRPFQVHALEALSRDGHLICVAPTGSGKSRIYEMHVARARKRAILVSPLIALARQQRESLRAAGIAVALALGPDPEPPPRASGVWIVSPERLSSPGLRAALSRWRPDFLVVDECHCFWDWGERFRPGFAEIPRVLSEFLIPQSLWMTATLSVDARLELKRALAENAMGEIIEQGEFDFPPQLYLGLERIPWFERTRKLLSFVREKESPGIIFVQTRKTADDLSRLISSTGRRALHYHAGLSSEERRNGEALIRAQRTDVIIATSAFGMGMDHPHLSWALLWQAPPSLLFLAQAIGRVSRRWNTASEARVFWDIEDFRLLEWMLSGSKRRKQELLQTYLFLTKENCRLAALRNYFGRSDALSSCSQCDFCFSGAYNALHHKNLIKLLNP